jgi:spermidine synthase
MGSTLPMLSRFLARRTNELGGAFGELYAANTLGAILGTLLAGFFLIELLGLTGTLWVGAGCTLVAGLVALVLDRRLSVIAPDRASLVSAPPDQIQIDSVPDDGKTARNWNVALCSAFVMGLSSLGYQVLWTRVLSSGTGNTTYVFTTILVIFLFGIAFGADLIGRRSTPLVHPIRLLGLAQLSVALLAIAGVALMSGRFVSLSFLPTTIIVVLPATVVLGLALPLASCIVAQGDERVGRDIGLLLGANTIGVVIGTSAVPFLLVPLLGSPRSVVALSVLNAVLGIALLEIAREGKFVFRWVRRSACAAVAFGATYALVTRPSFIADSTETRVARDGELIASTEDEVAAVQAGRLGGEKHLWVCGTGMTALTIDARLMAVLPMMLRPQADSMLVICFGMGSSFRSALIGGLRVDGVELVPSVPKMFNYYYADGDRFLADPRGRLVITDGRNYVELTDRAYDLIVVDPPPPIESSGTAVLYSREFYAASASRLTDGGLMMEWLPYGQTMDDLRAHVRTFASAFPEVMVAFGPGNFGTFLFGSRQPIRFDEPSIRKVLARPGVLENLAGVADSPALSADAWVSLIPRLVWISGSDDVSRFAGKGPLITDDRPLTEYFLLRRLTGSASPRTSEPNLRAAWTAEVTVVEKVGTVTAKASE